MVAISVYIGLFLSAFGAATLLPLQSEAVLTGLLLVATVGNVLGSAVNWWLGIYLEQWRERRWFPFTSAQLQTAQHRYQRYGYWSLLLSWVPVVGDPLTLVAGILREPLWKFLLLVTVAKGARYLVLALLVLQV